MMGELGRRLQEAREAHHISLKTAAKRLKINEKYLRALEEEQFEVLPQGAYILGFLRNYALFLNLNYKEIQELYHQHYEKKPEVTLAPGEKRKRTTAFVLTPGKVIGFFVAVASGLLLWYLFHQYQLLTAPPALALFLPRDGEVYDSKKINIVGQTDPDATLLINGEEVNLSSDGEFQQEFVAVKNGPAQVEVVSRNRISGKETRDVRTFTVNLPSSEVVIVNELDENGEPVVEEGDPADPTQPTVSTGSISTGEGLEMVVRAVDRVWFAAALDGQPAQEFILDKGQTRVLSAAESVNLRSGKAYATYISINGGEETLLGDASVVDQTWTVDAAGRVVAAD
jgi:transcriptional regulator with XRE-family HTH domain